MRRGDMCHKWQIEKDVCVRFLSGSPLFARFSDCPYTAKVRTLSDGLGSGEKWVTQKLEDAQITKWRHK